MSRYKLGTLAKHARSCALPFRRHAFPFFHKVMWHWARHMSDYTRLEPYRLEIFERHLPVSLWEVSFFKLGRPFCNTWKDSWSPVLVCLLTLNGGAGEAGISVAYIFIFGSVFGSPEWLQNRCALSSKHNGMGNWPEGAGSFFRFDIKAPYRGKKISGCESRCTWFGSNRGKLSRSFSRLWHLVYDSRH